MKLTQSERIALPSVVRKVGERTLSFVISTESKALDGGVLLSRGMDAGQFSRNPVVLWSHDQDKLAIGRGRNLRQTAAGWEIDIEFAPQDVNPFAEQVRRLIEWAGHGSTSVGFIVTDRRTATADERTKYGMGDYGWIGHKWTLLEVSIVNVPADGNALLNGGPESKSAKDALVWARSVGCKVETMAVKNDGVGSRAMESDPATPNESGADETKQMMMSMMEAMKVIAAEVASLKEMMMAQSEGEIAETATEEKIAPSTVDIGQGKNPPAEKDGEEDDMIDAKFFAALETLKAKL